MPTPIEHNDDEYTRFRALIFELSGYKTYEPEVDRFHASRAKTKIVSSPARTSKSYAAWKDVYPDVLYHGVLFAKDNSTIETQRIWIVAPNYDLAKEYSYAWTDLVERKEHMGFEYKLINPVNNPGQGNMKIRMLWGKNKRGEDVESIIEVRSAANEKQLQSEELDIVLLSEAARLHENVWSKYLSTRAGRSVWATTPDVEAAWIYNMIEAGKGNPGLSIDSFSFTPRANPKYKYDRYWIEHQKAEIRVSPSADLTQPADPNKPPSYSNGHDCFDPMVGCVAMKDGGFAEQFGGMWTFTRGRVVPIRLVEGMMGEPSHVVASHPKWADFADIHIAIDYGFSDPAVVGFWLISPTQVHLATSIWESGLTPDDVADKVRYIIKQNGWERRVKRMVGDPKKPEVVETFRKRGLPIWDVDKMAQADRKAGHLEFMNFLAVNPKTGLPLMTFHESNVEIIESFMQLRYKENIRNPYAENALIGARDDGYDMCRYFVQSRPPTYKQDKLITIEDTDFAKLRRSIVKNMAQKGRKATVPSMPPTGLARIGM